MRLHLAALAAAALLAATLGGCAPAYDRTYDGYGYGTADRAYGGAYPYGYPYGYPSATRHRDPRIFFHTLAPRHKVVRKGRHHHGWHHRDRAHGKRRHGDHWSRDRDRVTERDRAKHRDRSRARDDDRDRLRRRPGQSERTRAAERLRGEEREARMGPRHGVIQDVRRLERPAGPRQQSER